MTRTPCGGPSRDLDCGAWYCPVVPALMPRNDDWDEECAACRDGRQRAEERLMDMARDEGE